MKRLLVLLLLSFSFNSQAQYSVMGTVKDAKDNSSIPYATVALLRSDSSVVTGVITGEDGKFIMENVAKGNYLLQASFLGYEKEYRQVDVPKQSDLGIISIKENVTQLNEITVFAPKTLVVRSVDRLVFNVENSVAASGGDALDALKLTPGVQVRNDNVSLIGKSNMLVLVDDKEIHLSGNDLMNYLKTIPSENIKSIEVITTPPAKYEAEGNSGIINIVMKKAKEDSWNLLTSLTARQGFYFRWSPNVNFTLQKDKWSVLADISENQGKSIYTNHTTYLYPDDTFWKISEIMTNKSNYITPNLNVDYKITNKLSAGIQYTGSISTVKSSEPNTTNIYSNLVMDTINAVYDNYGITNEDFSTHSFNFNMLQKLDSLGKRISLDVDYFINQDNKENPFYTSNYYYYPTESQDYYYTTNNSNLKITNFSMRIDFEMPYKWATLNYGGKLNFTQTHSKVDGSFYQIVNSLDSLYLLQTDNFTYKENNQALYFSAEKSFGKKWTAKTGLRMENTQTSSISQPNNQAEETHKFNYTKLFPSAYLSYKLNNNNTFVLDYSRRIERPNYEALNPAKWYQSLYEIVYGNPFLQPSFTQNVSFTHTYKSLLTSKIWYSYSQSEWTQLETRDSLRNVNYIRENYANEKTFGISESLNWQIFPWLNTSSGVSTWGNKAYVFPTLYQYIESTYSGWGGIDFYTNNSFNLNKEKTLTGEMDFWYNTPGHYSFRFLGSHSSLNMGVKYQLRNKKLQVALFANNIIRTDQQTNHSIIQEVKQSFSQYFDTQYLRFTVIYRLGNDKINVTKHEGSNSEEKGRL